MSPAASILANAPRLAAFSTSSPDFAVVPKKKGTPAKPVKGTSTLRIKKKAITKTGRPPAPGERKAMRKRIILSNPNAIEVPGLKEMTAETLMDPSMVGKVATIPGPVVDQLRAVEAFKVPQGWGLFRAPSTLVREESRALTEKLLGAGEAKKTIVTVLDGARGTGKSMMLLQAMAAAFTDGWIVISIPEGES
jgi:small subunit ribosomal protein S29